MLEGGVADVFHNPLYFVHMSCCDFCPQATQAIVSLPIVRHPVQLL